MFQSRAPRSPPAALPVASLDLILLEGRDHLLELFAFDRLEGAFRLAQQKDLSRIVQVLDKVVDGALMVERVMELKLALPTGSCVPR